MAYTMCFNHKHKLWAIYPEINKDTPLMERKDVVWRKREDHALKVFQGKMKEMRR